MMRIGFMGLGNISQALIKGIRLNDKAINISAFDIDEKKFIKVKQLNVKQCLTPQLLAKNSDMIFLCVKPNLVTNVLSDLKPYLKKTQIIISVAAGIKISIIQKLINQIKVVRIMPNLPASYGFGMTAVKFGSKCTNNDMKKTLSILEKFGKTIKISRESKFDPITSISGSGPAFLAYYYDSVLEFCIKSGFTKKQSQNITSQTLTGALEFLKHSGMDPKKFIDKVSSRGGTTEEGVKALSKRGFKKIILEGHSRASEKSKLISNKISSIIKK